MYLLLGNSECEDYLRFLESSGVQKMYPDELTVVRQHMTIIRKVQSIKRT